MAQKPLFQTHPPNRTGVDSLCGKPPEGAKPDTVCDDSRKINVANDPIVRIIR
jgi:hypothetical protein